MNKGFLVREQFHLHFLRHLAARFSSRPYAVKGGICLRFFHHSPRLSEDMDIDISPGVPIKTLQNNVDAILSGAALGASLRMHGVESIESSRHKQTETTQRWKGRIIMTGGLQYFTRLEFSRRGLLSNVQRGVPDAEILKASFLPPFAASHYGALSMIRQKINALASPSRTAARDLFDLHHLFFYERPAMESLRRLIPSDHLKDSLVKIGRFEYEDFRDQVLPYLPGDLQMLYNEETNFHKLRDEVKNGVMELAQ